LIALPSWNAPAPVAAPLASMIVVAAVEPMIVLKEEG